MKDLCTIYQNNPALYEQDYEKEGFRWIDCHQEEKCIYVFERRSKKQRILVVFNFADKKQEYKLELDGTKELRLLLASDAEQYGGCEKYPEDAKVKLKKGIAKLKLNAFSGLMYIVH